MITQRHAGFQNVAAVPYDTSQSIKEVMVKVSMLQISFFSFFFFFR